MMHAPYFDLDGWPTLKLPPLEGVGAGLVYPVRLQPVDNVVVARHRDELLAPSPNGLSNGVTSNTRNRSVHNAGELIHHKEPIRLEHGAGYRGPKLLTV